MISGMSSVASNYLRPISTISSGPSLTPTEAQSDARATTESRTSSPGINVSQLTQLQAKPISAADDPVLHDLLATSWLMAHGASATQFVSDDAPQNTYAQVKVGGKVVATLYNGGSSTMTNEAAGEGRQPAGSSGFERTRSGAVAGRQLRQTARWDSREGVHRDHAVPMDAACKQFHHL